MNIALLEQEISERLACINIQGLEVVVVPDKQYDYKKAFAVPMMVVTFREITYERPNRIEDTTQRATAIVDVYLLSRWLREEDSHTGIYAMYDEARKKLVGYQPANYDPLYGVEFKLDTYEENVFMYRFTVAARCSVVPNAFTDDETGVPLRQVTFIQP